MRSFIFQLSILCLIAIGSNAEPDHTRPKSYLGFADSKGNVSFWSDLGAVGLSDGTSIPVRLHFKSATDSGSALFGRFWWCPILESSLVMLSERAVEFSTLGGRKIYLLRKKDGTFASGEGKYTARIVSKSETSVYADGWEYQFVAGKLLAAKTAGGVELEWVYQGTKLLSINDKAKGKLVSIEYSALESVPSALVIDKVRIDFKSQQVPIATDAMGQVVVAGFQPSLLEVKSPMMWQQFPIKLERNGEYAMEYNSDYWPARKYVWEAGSGVIKSDGEYTYRLDKAESGASLVSRVNKKGESESYFYDSVKGYSENRRTDGTLVARTYFINEGPTQYKIRKLTETKDGVEMQDRQWSYDELGRLIRERSGKYEHHWKWATNGVLVEDTESHDGKIFRQTVFNDQGQPVEKLLDGKTYRFAYENGKKIIQKIDSKGVITRVLDPAKNQVIVFKGDPKGNISTDTSAAFSQNSSLQELEAARALAIKNLPILETSND